MHIEQNHSKKRKYIIIIITTVILALAIAGAAFSLWLKKSTPEATANPAEILKEQQQAGNIAKKSTLDKIESSKKDSNTGSDQPPAPTPDPNGGKSIIGVEITAANQSGDTLQVRSLIQSVESSGECTLTLTKSGSTTYTKTADVQALSSSSTCKGFDIPSTDLAAGEWLVTVVFENATLVGKASKRVTIQ